MQALITPLEESPPPLRSPEEQSRRRLAAIRKLASLSAFSSIQDPVAWQREARRDRPLPGREP